MATLAQIRQGITDIVNATDDRITTYPYWGVSMLLPAAVLMVDDAGFNRVFDGSFMEWPLRLYVLVQYTDPEFAQVDLDQYIDPFGARSISDALNRENLGYANDVQVAVDGVSDYGDFEGAGVQHVGAVLNLTVRTKR